MTRPRARAGVTLVEVMVFSCVAMVIAACAWTFFLKTSRDTLRTESKLAGIESGLHLSLRLERDLRHLYEDREHPIRMQEDAQNLMVSFFRMDDESPRAEWTSLPLVEVGYCWEKATGTVIRQRGEAPPVPIPGHIRSLRFQFLKGQPPGDPGPTGVPSPPLPGAASVLFSVLGTAETAEAIPLQGVLLVGGSSRARLASYQAYDFWNPLPFGDGS